MKKQRRLRRLLLVVVATYVGLELASFLGYLAATGRVFSFSELAERRRELQQAVDAPRLPLPRDAARPGAAPAVDLGDDTPVLHPFLGYAFDPARRPERFNGWVFCPEGDPLVHGPDQIHVGIVGGSLAFEFQDSWNVLRAELAGVKGWESKEIELIGLSLPGFKQPQQLLAATYFLSLGGRLDVLINLDGFNEVGAEMSAVQRRGMYPTHPRMWQDLARDVEALEDRAGLEDLYALRRLRAELSRWGDRLAFSVTASTFWQLQDERLDARQAAAKLRYEDAVRGSRKLSMARFEGTREEAFALSIDNWQRSSRLLFELSRAEGFAYLHVLQPNQYVPDSKPFSDEEQRSFRSMQLLRQEIPQSYAELRARGSELAAEGIGFRDLSNVFLEEEETLYRDACCHLNERGYELLARELGAQLRRWLESGGR